MLCKTHVLRRDPQDALNQAYAERDDLILRLRVRRYEVSYLGEETHRGRYIGAIVAWSQLVFPAWWIADEDYECNLEVEATLVAGGIKVALITTAAGLTIAIPINVMHNYFVTKIDRLVIDMEESAQKMVDALHDRGRVA